jgi:hypothetical protein
MIIDCRESLRLVSTVALRDQDCMRELQEGKRRGQLTRFPEWYKGCPDCSQHAGSSICRGWSEFWRPSRVGEGTAGFCSHNKSDRASANAPCGRASRSSTQSVRRTEYGCDGWQAAALFGRIKFSRRTSVEHTRGRGERRQVRASPVETDCLRA